MPDAKFIFQDEIALLCHQELMSDPNLLKLIGYCHEEGKLGVGYDLEPCHTVYNLAPRGTHFLYFN